MGKAHLPGGLYLGEDGQYHDAQGKPVDKKTAEAAIKATEKVVEETGKPPRAETTTPAPGTTTEPPNTEDPDADKDKGGKRGKLPDDFPKKDLLEAASITTYGQLRKVEDFTTIEGIGPAGAEAITEALKG